MSGPPRRRWWLPWAGVVAAAGAVVATGRAERSLLQRWGREPGGPPRELPGPARERRVRVDDGAELRVLEWGEGPPIVLVHGITASSEDWLPVVSHLVRAGGHRIVAVDQRGHGASTLGTSACDTDRLAVDLGEVLERLDLRDVVLVGHSLGGYVALAVAGGAPATVRRRLASLVVLGAPHTGRGTRELATLASVAVPWTPALQRSDVHGAVLTGLLVFGTRPERPSVDDVRQRWSRCDPATRRCFARHLAGESVTRLLPSVAVPVVVARGSEDHIVTARRNRSLVRHLPHASAMEVEGAGHALLPERPAVVAATILEAAHRHVPVPG